MFAQNDEFCGTPNTTQGDQTIFSKSTDLSMIDNMNPVVINLFYWQVTGSHGEYGGIQFDENKILESVAFLNQKFNESKIFFKYRGYDVLTSPTNIPLYVREEIQSTEDQNGDGVVDSDDVILACVDQNQFDPLGYADLGRCEITGTGLPWEFKFFNWVANNGYVNETALNIYVPFANNGGFGGAANYIGGKLNTVRYDRLTSFSFAHEIGHNLGLRHTRSNYEDPSTSWENVTRDELLPNGNVNPDFNAYNRADGLVGTAANIGFWRYDPSNQDYYPTVDDNCAYTGTDEDQTGEPFAPSYLDLVNVMSNAYECMEAEFSNNNKSIVFTNDQRIKMLEKVSSNSYQNQRTTISSLYEPYAGEYYGVGPTLPNHTTYFQPGFDYQFIKCSGTYPQPAPYNDNFSYNAGVELLRVHDDTPISNYQNINHPNHSAILIYQVDDALGYSKPQKCYNNYNKGAKGGKITRFNDNYFNNNVTVTLKDSLSINNNNLINTLENGLYSIDKEFDDGTVQQTVIQKGGN